MFLLLEVFIRSIFPPFYSFSLVERICKRKLKKRPNNHKAIWLLSNLYLWYGKNQEARIQLESLMKFGIARRADKLLLSKAYYRLGLYKKVEKILGEGNVLSDKDIENCYMGSSLVELGKFEIAITYLERFLYNHNTKDYLVFTRLGYAYYMAGIYDHALRMYKQAEKLKPTEKGIKDNIKLSDVITIKIKSQIIV